MTRLHQLSSSWLLAAAATSLGLACMPAQATLTINPPTNLLATSDQNANCNADCVEGLLAGGGFNQQLTEVYKWNANNTEAGSFAASYSGSSADNAESATISWNGPSFINCGTCILLAKDGNQSPNIYIWNLGGGTINGIGGYGWDGKEAIFVSDPLLWPNQGSISHLSIFSTNSDSGCTDPQGCFPTIPEPGSLALAGMALLGLAGTARRFR